VKSAVTWVRANPILATAILAGLIARIVFWAWPGRILDDALITIKHAKNLVEGHGLTHHLGEDGPVHGFTSALSVLVPIPGEAIGPGGGLVFLRVASLIAFAAAAVYADRICRLLELGRWPLVLVLGYLALDQNQIFFGMAGMETQIATAVLLAGIYYVAVGDIVKAGVMLGLAPLARPDFVLWVAPAYAYLLFADRKRALRAGLISAAILAPWLIFTTVYYGSPIPNTIVAKSMAFPVITPALTDVVGWLNYWPDLVNDIADLGPFLERGLVTGTPVPKLVLEIIAWAVFLFAALGAATTWKRPAMRPAIAFAGLWILYRLFFLRHGFFEWYEVPVMAVVVILAGAGLEAATRWRPAVAPIAAVVIAGTYAAVIPFSYPIEARIQDQIENPVRDRLGRYLGTVIKPGQTLTGEPAGYVGFYTNATYLDYPGLTSTRVTDSLDEADIDAERTQPVAYYVPRFRPDWLILRPAEWALVKTYYPEVVGDYRQVRDFKAPIGPRLDLGGYSVFDIDTEFLVLRRITAS
jgi:hypothetical protein